MDRIDDGADAERRRDRDARAPGPAPPNATSANVRGILALLQDMQARGARHVLVDDVVDAPGGPHRATGRVRRKFLANGAFRRRVVEPDAAAGEIARIEIAEDEIGIGDRRLGRRPARSRPGPARRRRFRARRASGRRCRCEAMLPPPAPISFSATLGQRNGKPLPALKRWTRATSSSLTRGGVSPVSTAILAVVPPMSKTDEPIVAGATPVKDRRDRAGGGSRLDHPDRKLRVASGAGKAAVRLHDLQATRRCRDAARPSLQAR